MFPELNTKSNHIILSTLDTRASDEAAKIPRTKTRRKSNTDHYDDGIWNV